MLCFDDFFDDRQPNSRTVAIILNFESLEDRKDFFVIFWGDARAVIFNDKFMVIGMFDRRNLQMSGNGSMVLDSVAD